MDQQIRHRLQEQLKSYVSATLKYTETVKEFFEGESDWSLQRVSELERMSDIKNQDDSRRQELGEVLEKTLKGLEKLQHFLDAVEMLAVTSSSVFRNESFMPQGVSSMSVRSVISAARKVAPLLVHFKRDAGAFFLLSLSNVEVLAFQLDKYIHVTQQICEKMERRSVAGFGAFEWIYRNASWELDLNMSEESMQTLDDHLLQLTRIRMDESFRMTFLFNIKAQVFVRLFSECHFRMLQFLSDLDEAADQLDKMKLGSDISSVAGSSVGITGGILSIAGLALAPFTAGASLALTVTGVGLGVTSGVNSLVTGITEMAVNNHHGKNANNICSRFMNDMQKILDCMEEVDGASGDLNANAVNMGLQEANTGRTIPKLVADLPDIGQLAKGSSLALSRSARAGLMAVNAFFIGLDVFFIYKDSISLSKGSKNEVAQLIRSRSVLWRSEVEAWKKICDHLCEGISGFDKNQEILEQDLNI